MPELPDVEGFRRVLAEGAGRRIESVEPSIARFCETRRHRGSAGR